MGKIDYKMMDKFVDEECHLIINALSKDSFSKCNIPGSINIPLLSLKRNPKDPKKSENIEDIIKKHLKDFPKLKESWATKKCDSMCIQACGLK